MTGPALCEPSCARNRIERPNDAWFAAKAAGAGNADRVSLGTTTMNAISHAGTSPYEQLAAQAVNRFSTGTSVTERDTVHSVHYTPSLGRECVHCTSMCALHTAESESGACVGWSS